MSKPTHSGKFVDKADVRLGLMAYEELEDLKTALVAERLRARVFRQEFPPEKEKELADVIAAKKELRAKLP